MRSRVFLAALAGSLVTQAVAKPSPRDDPLVTWTKGSTVWPFGEDWEHDTTTPVSPNEYISLSIGLPQSNPSGLEDALLSVSDPSSASYGKFLSKSDVLGYLVPEESNLVLVKEWLATQSITIDPPSTGVLVSPAGDWIDLNITVSQANALFGTNFTAYFSDYIFTRTLRATSYNIPQSLLGAIYTLQPTTIPDTSGLLPPSSRRRRDVRRKPEVSRRRREHTLVPKAATNCLSSDGSATPACLRELYNVGNYTPSASSANRIGVAGYLENVAQFSDLQQYLEVFNPAAAAVNYTFNIVSPLEPAGPQSDSFQFDNEEANLDIQVVAGLVAPIPSTFYSVSGENPDLNTADNSNEPYLALVSYLLSLEDADLPSVLTTSYGDDEQSVSEAYAERVCTGFAALGARGVTVIFSTGDEGVGPDAGGPGELNFCETIDGTNRTRYDPNFPASCPWVTSVGETGNIPEVGSGGSGGGFSNYFSRPAYQDAAVTGYLDFWGDTYASYFNRGGRAIPDVASYGEVPLFNSGTLQSTFGTSCAAPTVAALVALLNDHRLQNNLPKLGFLNPLLYSTRAQGGFNDITQGNNFGCGTNGFNATTGWDPVTGLGSLNFGALLDVVVPN